MAHFPDLSRCDYYHDDTLPPLTAVGWLERGHDYATGSVPPALVPRLIEFWRSRMNLLARFYLGDHSCTLCNYHDPYMQRGELFIPSGQTVYAAPQGVIHYIRDHRYRPPDDFVAAVLAAPAPRSVDYLAALHAAGWPEPYLASLGGTPSSFTRP